MVTKRKEDRYDNTSLFEPHVRFELTTCRLQGGCSTTELKRQTGACATAPAGRSLKSRGMRPLDSTRQTPIALVRSSLPSRMMTENRSASGELRDSHKHPSRSGTLQLLVQPASADSATDADQSSLLHNNEQSPRSSLS